MRVVSVLRIASRALQKSAVPQAARLSPVFARNFTSTPKYFSGVTSQLTDALNNEIKAEKQLEAENLGGAQAPQIPGFTVTTKDAEVTLTKTHGSEKIKVYFNVNHSVNMDEEFDVEGQVQESDPVPVALPPLDVEIIKGNQRFCFHLDLVHAEEEGQFDYSVAEFYVAPVGTPADESVPEHVYASSGKYIDPSLHDLLFVQFLEERGFSQQFCQDVVHYATHYEHTQYVNLLEQVKNFVSKQ